MTEDKELICKTLDISLIRFRIISKSKKSDKLYYRYYYIINKLANEIFKTTVSDLAMFRYNIEVAKSKKDETFRQVILKEENVKPKVSNIYDENLINLIEFRLDAIHTITIKDYNTVKTIIETANLYNLNYKYITTIKDRFKHFRL